MDFRARSSSSGKRFDTLAKSQITSPTKHQLFVNKKYSMPQVNKSKRQESKKKLKKPIQYMKMKGKNTFEIGQGVVNFTPRVEDTRGLPTINPDLLIANMDGNSRNVPLVKPSLSMKIVKSLVRHQLFVSKSN